MSQFMSLSEPLLTPDLFPSLYLPVRHTKCYLLPSPRTDVDILLCRYIKLFMPAAAAGRVKNLASLRENLKTLI